MRQEKEGSNMIRFVGFIPATVAFFTMSSIAHAQYNEPALGTGTKTVEIVIENATKGQVFSPGVFASHRSGVKLWAEGEPASLGLRLLAEDGNIDPFMYETMKGIGKDFGSTTVIYPIDPGQKQKAVLKVSAEYPLVSGAIMLGMTNDGFLNPEPPQHNGHAQTNKVRVSREPVPDTLVETGPRPAGFPKSTAIHPGGRRQRSPVRFRRGCGRR
jgi:hypothetical protein